MQVDVPHRALDQAVGIVELQHTAAHFHLVAGRRGQLAQQRIIVRHAHQLSQIACARLVAAGQARRLHIVCGHHADLACLAVHARHECRHAARIGAAQCMRSAVFAGHQRQMQQFATAERRAHRQARAAEFFGVHIILRDGDGLVHVQMRFGNQQTRHELGQRSNRQHRAFVLAEQHFLGVLVDHQCHTGLQRQRILHIMQPRNLPERLRRRRVGNGPNRCLGAARSQTIGLADRCRHSPGLGAGRLRGLAGLLGRGLGHLAFGACGNRLFLDGNRFLFLGSVCSWRGQGHTQGREGQRVEKTGDDAISGLHQDAPSGNKQFQCTQSKKVAQDQELMRLF
ncbi:hypothetical protein SDC9_141077 [bioreactor metagenome]|uniref:Uncharacterized protein n=1 Tax=bioreactor metagenome TaxID=1076179 RepID=A0A645DXA1_9ZZZZ